MHMVALPYLGLPHRLTHDPARARRVVVGEAELLVGGPAQGLDGRVRRWLERQLVIDDDIVDTGTP